jgi:hypothetical protein
MPSCERIKEDNVKQHPYNLSRITLRSCSRTRLGDLTAGLEELTAVLVGNDIASDGRGHPCSSSRANLALSLNFPVALTIISVAGRRYTDLPLLLLLL